MSLIPNPARTCETRENLLLFCPGKGDVGEGTLSPHVIGDLLDPGGLCFHQLQQQAQLMTPRRAPDAQQLLSAHHQDFTGVLDFSLPVVPAGRETSVHVPSITAAAASGAKVDLRTLSAAERSASRRPLPASSSTFSIFRRPLPLLPRRSGGYALTAKVSHACTHGRDAAQ